MELRREHPVPLESPGLYRDEAATPAFEMKFLLSREAAAAIEERLGTRLILDSHADPALGNAYRVTSVYFETAAFDVYAKTEGYRKRKFRIRRYGDSTTAFLERKTKTKQQVRKRRTAVPLEELNGLDEPADEQWSGYWFAQQLAKRGLQPVCRVSYERVAMMGTSPDGPIRATFDRALHGSPSTTTSPDWVSDGAALLSDAVIAEFKFLGAMPTLFKTVVEEMKLTPKSVSKYRRCLEANGIVKPEARDG